MKPAPPSKDWDILKLLKDMGSQKAEYPPELLSARRSAFLRQLAQHKQVEIEEVSPSDMEIITLLKDLKSVEASYPSRLLEARRSAFKDQIGMMNHASWWYSLRTALRSWWSRQIEATPSSTVNWLRTSLVVAGLALAAFVGFLSYGNRDQPIMASPSLEGRVQSGRVLTTDNRETTIICKPGFEPPLCLAGEANKDQGLAFQGNGSAQPAVAKDTMPGFNGNYHASYINDGLYGPGSSWISRSHNSWIKIDLGKTTTIDTVEFGRDRLGKYNDRSPGQFVISVALTDNIYADGNSSNDDLEYTQVYNSEQDGFNGTISGPETVSVRFDPQMARYIKITFEKAGTAIDEVQAFMLQPPVLVSNPSRTPRDEEPEDTPTPLPTNTRPPTATATATPVPTNNTLLPTSTATPLPTSTATPLPTNTPLPTSTATPLPTNTPLPTSTPLPTKTATTPPTNTPPATTTPLPTNSPPSTATAETIPTDLLYSSDLPPGFEP